MGFLTFSIFLSGILVLSLLWVVILSRSQDFLPFLIQDISQRDKNFESIEKIKFTDLPDDWKCPRCGVGKENFVKID